MAGVSGCMDGWKHVEAMPPLKPGRIQVWRVWLEDPGRSRAEIESLLGAAHALLTDQERARAARMRAGGPREEFVAGRGCLRLMLGSALAEDPRGTGLETGEHGKPGLAGHEGLEFNVAHSRGMVLIALSRAGTVGVDVEFRDAGSELVDVARTAFHPADVARLQAVETEPERRAEFYRCWTRREAVAKADGRGLTIPVTEFAVGVAAQVGRYFVRKLEVGPRHAAALACERADVEMDLLEFSLEMATSLGPKF